MIILLREAFLVIVGRWNPILKNPFCVACLSFQIKGSSSFPKKGPVPPWHTITLIACKQPVFKDRPFDQLSVSNPKIKLIPGHLASDI